MSTTTNNLGLFKYDTSTDANVAFSITKALNNNWDIIDKKCGMIDSKVDTSSLAECVVIIDSYVNGTSGYNVYSNGYCEQWGKINCSANSQANGTLLKTYKDTNYNFIAIDNTSALNGGVYGYQQGCGILTNNTFFVRTAYDSTVVYSWKTCGYIEYGEY